MDRLKINRELARDLERLTATLAESRGDLNLPAQTVERVIRTALPSVRRFKHLNAKLN